MALRPNTPQSRSEQLATRQAAQEDGFLREVDEAVRQDEVLGLARRYGRPVGAAVIAGLLAFAGYLWWDHSREQAAAGRAEEMTLALDQIEAGNLAAGDAKLKALVSSSEGGSRAVATMMRAGIAVEQGRQDEAANLFAAVSADETAPKPYRDLANIREVAIRFDKLPPADVINRLKPLAVPGNAWFGNAGELVAMAYMKQGRNDLAGPLFASIAKNKDVPETLRSRARQMAGLLGVDAIDDVNQAAGMAAPAQPGQ